MGPRKVMTIPVIKKSMWTRVVPRVSRGNFVGNEEEEVMVYDGFEFTNRNLSMKKFRILRSGIENGLIHHQPTSGNGALPCSPLRSERSRGLGMGIAGTC